MFLLFVCVTVCVLQVIIILNAGMRNMFGLSPSVLGAANTPVDSTPVRSLIYISSITHVETGGF